MTPRRIVLLASALLLTTAAHGAENWQALSFTTTPQNLPKVIAATDKFMASEAGKSMPGTLSIMANTVDGADPATNSFITSMPSLEDIPDAEAPPTPEKHHPLLTADVAAPGAQNDVAALLCFWTTKARSASRCAPGAIGLRRRGRLLLRGRVCSGSRRPCSGGLGWPHSGRGRS